MKVTANVGRLDVERSIAPPMSMAVTVPATVDGKGEVVIYVGLTAFRRAGGNTVMDKDLQEIARKIGAALNLKALADDDLPGIKKLSTRWQLAACEVLQRVEKTDGQFALALRQEAARLCRRAEAEYEGQS